ncbi:T-cell surface glycoprotein CD3 epsilon chain-like [Scleropages formosus]|uniref:T-cell surface glycoprotein CD3 epsilon chain-like n=1 Tax=Scleropages formosus TaxID=113540 RepID=UPI00087873D6|nr:T-cell surface glycoprotein CD3 epsilon chain-like [Scleropages formosus]XP_018604090.1 T-cell surface glycoprotein CD3 epsilon chain-like [Scleropages formosus]
MRRALFFFSISLTVMACKGVQLTCPGHSPVSWDGKYIPEEVKSESIILEDFEGLVRCSYDKNQTYYFYINDKAWAACKNCVKLDGASVVIVIAGDLLLTAGVMLVACICGRRKLRVPAVPPAQPRPQGPTTSSCEYEALSPTTRDNALYSVSGLHRTG